MEPVAHHYLRNILITTLAVGVVGGVSYTGYTGYQKYIALEQTKNSLEAELAKTKEDFSSTTESLAANIEALKQLLAATNADKMSAEQDVQQQQDILNSMTGTVATYKKLMNTDPELLAKYSRVYFLNENYTPKSSVVIPGTYIYNPAKEELMLKDAWPFLKDMMDAAVIENVDLKIISAFRSFDTQTKLKSAYTVTYGIGSNKFSADQGYSEHQLGTAIDFTTAKLGVNFSTFEKTSGYTWLTENAYKYGFILSYPKGNSYYIFEPWHWRFVGKALALRLHNDGKNFYDLTQRDIDSYLVTLFDK